MKLLEFSRYGGGLLLVAALSGCLGGGDGGVITATPPTMPIDTTPPPTTTFAIANPSSLLAPLGVNVEVTSSKCVTATFGATIDASLIALPTTGASVSTATWVAASGATPAYCRVEGFITPVDPTSFRIRYLAGLPGSWNHRSLQGGGGGNNGTAPSVTSVNGQLASAPINYGFAVFGSDSGHANSDGNAWTTNDESAKNFGYMQMKKTYDVAMILIEKMYGEKPRFKYYYGSSQGGREGLTVGQRWANDYDGIMSDVPVVEFSSLIMSPTWNQIQQSTTMAWIPTAKGNAIRAEIMRQCDGLDNLMDGIISNYQGCRAIFDVTRGASGRNPWASKRCPANVDPAPADTTVAACFTDGQIETLKFLLKPYTFATPMVNGLTTFGGYMPGPGTPSLLNNTRFAGQEGGGATVFGGGLGGPMTLGTILQNLSANPITDYVEGGAKNARRLTVSEWFDASNADLDAFYKKGGKWLMTIGTDDTTASPASQLNYFQSVVDKMGRDKVDAFARFWVLPQAGHSASGNNANIDGNGNTITTEAMPSGIDRLYLLTQWVENNVAPGKSVVAYAANRARPICSYPEYPKYVSGNPRAAESFSCVAP
ncbi:MAG: tannase/feruloyl esterase family alpha/beta hydrolase [Comamonadaceae bacterium]|nr:MAG: tannase/feruloyl esterase family alpha/beta hydrolase [Comamonadaceae bacterium]